MLRATDPGVVQVRASIDPDKVGFPGRPRAEEDGPVMLPCGHALCAECSRWRICLDGVRFDAAYRAVLGDALQRALQDVVKRRDKGDTVASLFSGITGAERSEMRRRNGEHEQDESSDQPDGSDVQDANKDSSTTSSRRYPVMSLLKAEYCSEDVGEQQAMETFSLLDLVPDAFIDSEEDEESDKSASDGGGAPSFSGGKGSSCPRDGQSDLNLLSGEDPRLCSVSRRNQDARGKKKKKKRPRFYSEKQRLREEEMCKEVCAGLFEQKQLLVFPCPVCNYRQPVARLLYLRNNSDTIALRLRKFVQTGQCITCIQSHDEIPALVAAAEFEDAGAEDGNEEQGLMTRSEVSMLRSLQFGTEASFLKMSGGTGCNQQNHHHGERTVGRAEAGAGKNNGKKSAKSYSRSGAGSAKKIGSGVAPAGPLKQHGKADASSSSNGKKPWPWRFPNPNVPMRKLPRRCLEAVEASLQDRVRRTGSVAVAGGEDEAVVTLAASRANDHGASMASSSSNHGAHTYKEDLEYLIQAVKSKELELKIRVAHIWDSNSSKSGDDQRDLKEHHMKTMMMKIKHLKDLMEPLAVRQDENREAENKGSTEQAVKTLDEGVRLLVLTLEGQRRREAVHADLVQFWGQQAVDNPDLRNGSPELFDALREGRKRALVLSENDLASFAGKDIGGSSVVVVVRDFTNVSSIVRCAGRILRTLAASAGRRVTRKLEILYHYSMDHPDVAHKLIAILEKMEVVRIPKALRDVANEVDAGKQKQRANWIYNEQSCAEEEIWLTEVVGESWKGVGRMRGSTRGEKEDRAKGAVGDHDTHSITMIPKPVADTRPSVSEEKSEEQEAAGEDDAEGSDSSEDTRTPRSKEELQWPSVDSNGRYVKVVTCRQDRYVQRLREEEQEADMYMQRVRDNVVVLFRKYWTQPLKDPFPEVCSGWADDEDDEVVEDADAMGDHDHVQTVASILRYFSLFYLAIFEESDQESDQESLGKQESDQKSGLVLLEKIIPLFMDAFELSHDQKQHRDGDGEAFPKFFEAVYTAIKWCCQPWRGAVQKQTDDVEDWVERKQKRVDCPTMGFDADGEVLKGPGGDPMEMFCSELLSSRFRSIFIQIYTDHHIHRVSSGLRVFKLLFVCLLHMRRSCPEDEHHYEVLAHFRPPKEKLTSQWCEDMTLSDILVELIQQYAITVVNDRGVVKYLSDRIVMLWDGDPFRGNGNKVTARGITRAVEQRMISEGRSQKRNPFKKYFFGQKRLVKPVSTEPSGVLVCTVEQKLSKHQRKKLRDRARRGAFPDEKDSSQLSDGVSGVSDSADPSLSKDERQEESAEAIGEQESGMRPPSTKSDVVEEGRIPGSSSSCDRHEDDRK